MSDILIRDVPDDVLAALDLLSKRLGLSRIEYIRRRLTQDARTAQISVTASDWRRFGEVYGDLGDSSVMDQAWR